MSSKTALELTVAEARPGDVGRGMARLDPKDMALLGDRVQLGKVSPKEAARMVLKFGA
ncbi:MAG: hypothetical protein HYY01_14415 [Chloroflexi bacterium]|nr:hypothetical protein [Chloroflexota bacterium]